MELLEGIKSRRIEKTETFNGKIIPKELIIKLLEAADWAPTHGFTEPWRYLIYSGASLKKFCFLHAELYKSQTQDDSFSLTVYEKLKSKFLGVSHLLAIYAQNTNHPKISFHEEIVATACSIQNLLLTANDLGISAYWGTGGMTYHQGMKEILQISEKTQVMGLIYLGYSDSFRTVQGKRVRAFDEKFSFIELEENDKH